MLKKFNNTVIESFGYYLPESVMTSDEIEDRLTPVYDRLKLPKGRLELQTGIKSRRYWDRGAKPSDLSTRAALECFKTSSIRRDNIDLLIHASVCRDFLEPATASVVHRNLELKSTCNFFDLSNACLGVMSSILLAANMIENGAINSALIVSGENGGPLLFETIDQLNNDTSLTRKSIKSYIANLTIGSAATAILLTHKNFSPNSPRILGGFSMADTNANDLCKGGGNTDTLMMQTNSEEMLRAGVCLIKNAWGHFLSGMDWDLNSFNKIIGHQVGTAHRNAILEAMGVKNNIDYSTFPTLGNTGSSALPITLMKAVQEGFITKGDTISLIGIGSGLTTTMIGVEW